MLFWGGFVLLHALGGVPVWCRMWALLAWGVAEAEAVLLRF